MADQKRPLQPGDAASAFTLPSANREGTVSLSDLRGQPFLIGFFRGLHCPFCRRQLVQLGAIQPALRAVGVETLAVINTPVERARMYYRHRPTPVTLLSDPDCLSHRAFGVPYGAFLPEGSTETPKWPYKATMDQFMAARVNPTGELPGPTQPMEANPVLNAKDGFVMEEADQAIAGQPRHTARRALSRRCGRHRPLGADRSARRARINSPPFRARRSWSPPRAASHAERQGQHRKGNTTSESRSTPAFAHTSSARMKYDSARASSPWSRNKVAMPSMHGKMSWGSPISSASTSASS